MKEKEKKKKLTLTVSSTPHRATHYAQSKGKTSVVIEKKPQRKWGGKKFQPKDIFNKPSIVLTTSQDNLKGSARSIFGFDIGLVIKNAFDNSRYLIVFRLPIVLTTPYPYLAVT